jgi:hypothetical protein
LPTKYLFIVMQISEYDITNEIGEHSYCLHDLIFYIIYKFLNLYNFFISKPILVLLIVLKT